METTEQAVERLKTVEEKLSAYAKWLALYKAWLREKGELPEVI